MQPRHITGVESSLTQPRTRGEVVLSAKPLGARSVIGTLRQSGAFKALFPRCGDMLQSILVNTSGGLTSGDRLSLTAKVDANAALGLTTQAAERAYRSANGQKGRVTTTIDVAENATLHWLPQELILYDGCALDRRLTINLAPTARLLMVEPIVFGRRAMGEVLTTGTFHDRIRVNRADKPLYYDATQLTGNISRTLARSAIGAGAGAMTSLLYVSPDAETRLDAIRAHLPATGGASLLANDVLTLRLVAEDSHILRQHLLPILDLLSGNTLPVSWRL